MALEGKSLIAVLGVLGGLFGGGLTAGFGYLFDSMSREEIELSTRRAEAYLSFIRTRSERDVAYSALYKAIEEASKAEAPPPMSPADVQGVCRKLIDPNRAHTDWSMTAKQRVAELCAAWNEVRSQLFTVRDTLAIYGSDGVIAQLARNERARYGAPTSQEARDSYVALIQKMRQDGPDQSGSDVEDRDLLAVICGGMTECLGYPDASHLEEEK